MPKLTSIALVIPYFGKLPDYFPAWKMSAASNPTVDFLFFTDIASLNSEGNLHVFHMSFGDFREMVQKKFDFPISLERPYKLCDYKPTYGYVLQEYLKDYDFWGHCDIDLIFGNIRNFITEEILSSHDKILELGHFTLYRNTPAVNEHFMQCKGYGDYDYKKTFTTDDSLFFDECLGMRLISRKLGVKTYLNEEIFFDVGPNRKEFHHISGEQLPTVFEYRDGALFALSKRKDAPRLKKEIMYAHFQKRTIKNMDETICRFGNAFYIVPNKIVSLDRPEKSLYKVNGGGWLYRVARSIKHIREYIGRYKKGDYGSFRAYRLERANLGKNIREAKLLIKNMEVPAEGD